MQNATDIPPQAATRYQSTSQQSQKDTVPHAHFFLTALEVVQRRFQISQSMIFHWAEGYHPPMTANQAGWNRRQPLSSLRRVNAS